MRLVKYDIRKIDGMRYRSTELLDLIDEFVNSGEDCTKVEGWKHASASSCACAFNQAIKRFSKKNIKAVERKGEVFLIRIKDEK